MIKIELIKAIPNRTEIDIATDITNRASADFSNMLKEKLKRARCEEHPDITSIITVEATPNKDQLFEVNKKDFCCERFKNSIVINQN